MTRIGIYARRSEDRDGTNTSTARQAADCEALCQAKGWTVVDTYIDPDLSAWKAGVVRPEFERLLTDLSAGSLDGVVCWKLDRLTRNRSDYYRLADLIEKRQLVLAAAREPIDTSTPLGWTVLDLLSSFARLESDTISMRTKRANREIAEQGRPHVSGQRPFGYTRQYEVVADEAALIVEAATRVLAGESTHSIAKAWNDSGVATTAGKLWRPYTVGRMLCGPHLAGMRVHRPEPGVEKVYEGTWTPILDEVTHRRLKARLAAKPRGGQVRSYLLAGGLVVCGRCGCQMHSRPRDTGRRGYVCRGDPGHPGCGRMAVVAEPLEMWVCDAVALRLRSDQFAAEAAAARGQVEGRESELIGQVTELSSRLDGLAAEAAAGRLSARQLSSASQLLEQRLEQAQRQLVRIRGRQVVAEVDLSMLDGLTDRDRLSFGRARAVVAAVVDRVEVSAAVRGRNRFDPGRINIVWRV